MGSLVISFFEINADNLIPASGVWTNLYDDGSPYPSRKITYAQEDVARQGLVAVWTF